jgi:molybdate transport system regulatory protein
MRIKGKGGRKNIFLSYKVWLSSVTGDGAVGETEYRLLKHIAESKSLKAASDDLGISYRKAWGDLKQTEELLGYQLLEKQRGGKTGGTSVVTDKARNLIEAYEALQKTFDDQAETAFNKFKDKIK